jgi:hypothetical protein
LADVPSARRYLGDLGRSKFYQLLPEFDVVKIDARTFVTVDSLDRFIARRRRGAS